MSGAAAGGHSGCTSHLHTLGTHTGTTGAMELAAGDVGTSCHHTFFSRWPSCLQSRDPPAPPRLAGPSLLGSIPFLAPSTPHLHPGAVPVSPGQYLMPQSSWSHMQKANPCWFIWASGLCLRELSRAACSQEENLGPHYAGAIECRW